MRHKNRLPSYRHHKPSGQAVVTLSGQDIYLGPFNSEASRHECDRVVAEWLAAGRTPASSDHENSPSVATLVNAFRKSEDYCTSHDHDYVAVWKLLVSLYGRTPARDFGPLALKAVRQQMIEKGWNRNTINRRVHIARRVFRWGVANEMLPAINIEALQAVEGLRYGRSAAPEPEAVEPVSIEHVEACLPFMPKMIQSMVKLQLYSGMRPGELVIMKTEDLETSAPTWRYRPSTHKTAYRGHRRDVVLGPKAQSILKPLLKTDLPAFIFSPAESEKQRREAIHISRKTPPAQGNEIGSNRVRAPRRSAGDCYDVAAYRYAIYRAADKAFPVPEDLSRLKGEREKAWRLRLGDRWCEVTRWRNEHRWHPHQLRHTFAHETRRQFGLEHTQSALGHANAKMTERYAQVAIEKAIEVATRTG